MFNRFCLSTGIPSKVAPAFSNAAARCATTSVFPEPAHAMNCKFPGGHPMAFF
jgi:hypothetical protein